LQNSLNGDDCKVIRPINAKVLTVVSKDNLSILVIQATMERASDFGRCLKQRPKSEEARSIACLRVLKSGEARASVPQWHRRPW